MQSEVGSFEEELTYDGRSCHGWIDVQSSLATPLLSWKHCKELGVVPRNFPKQIPAAGHTADWVRK